MPRGTILGFTCEREEVQVLRTDSWNNKDTCRTASLVDEGSSPKAWQSSSPTYASVEVDLLMLVHSGSGD